MKIEIVTLGCKVNQFESQAMADILAKRGYEIVKEGADACIINTCAVTAESGRKSRQMVRHAREKNPGAYIAVCGCWPQVSEEESKALEADLVYGSGDRLGFIDKLERGVREVCIDDSMSRREFEFIPAAEKQERTRAALKIQDGCDNYCAYCVIPYARGHARSLSMDVAVSEAGRLAALGYKEIVITGIEISSYGRDLPGNPSLTELLSKISAAATTARLRLGSLHPTLITENFCRELKKVPRLCPHFHLSLQSGCSSVLKRMGRRYGAQDAERAIELLRKYFPGCAIAADIIVGFPGESEEKFTETCIFLEKNALAAMHIFPYSPRPGTPAAVMDGQIDKTVKKARASKLASIAEANHIKYLDGCVGTSQKMLVERCRAGESLGHAENYMPVRCLGRFQRGEIYDVIIEKRDGDILVGKVTDLADDAL